MRENQAVNDIESSSNNNKKSRLNEQLPLHNWKQQAIAKRLPYHCKPHNYIFATSKGAV